MIQERTDKEGDVALTLHLELSCEMGDMMRRLIFFLLMNFSLFYIDNAIGGCEEDCLSGYEFERVGLDAVSFELPAGMDEYKIDGVDSFIREWRGGRGRIVYSRVLSGHSVNEYSDCFLRHGKAVIRICSEDNLFSLVADDPYSNSNHSIIVEFPNIHESRYLIEKIADTINYINRWSEMAFVGVLCGVAYIRNEDGVVRAVKVGDVITRDHGRVIEIGEGNIVVSELFPDGAGGYIEVYKDKQVEPQE